MQYKMHLSVNLLFFISAAPSTPPKLYLVQYLGNNKYEIQWKPPEEPNGDIFSYQMKIDIFNDNFRKFVACMTGSNLNLTSKINFPAIKT